MVLALYSTKREAVAVVTRSMRYKREYSSNIVWIFVVSSGVPILKCDNMDTSQNKGLIPFVMVQTGRLYNEHISRRKQRFIFPYLSFGRLVLTLY